MKKLLIAVVSFFLLTCVCGLMACGPQTETPILTPPSITSKIKFNTLTVEGSKVSGTVSNSTEIFSFIDEVAIEGDATFMVDDKITCQTPILSKMVQLEVGDNVFYVFEIKDDKISSIYTVTIRRRATYLVAFNTKGGDEIEEQIVEEDCFATMPPSPTRAGYFFDGWDFDIKNSKITQDIAFKTASS